MTQIDLKDLRISVNVDTFAEGVKYKTVTGISRYLTKVPWSPMIFKNGIRRQENFLYCDWAVLDFDDGCTLEEAIQRYEDCIYIIGTTRSHTDNHHKFRVCIPWERRITSLDDLRYNQARIIKYHQSDPVCKDGARFYYPCKEIISWSGEGFREEVVKAPPPKPVETKKPGEAKGFTRTVCRFMRDVIAVGKRNTTVHNVAKDLFRIGLSKETIMEIIAKSPTYRDGPLEGNLLREIEDTVKRGRAKVHGESQRLSGSSTDDVKAGIPGSVPHIREQAGQHQRDESQPVNARG